MTKNSVIVVVLGAIAAGFLLGVALTDRPEPKAAATLTGFLVLVLLMLGTVGAGVVLVPGWLKQRKRQAELEEAERLAQIYGALSGKLPQRPTARRPAQSRNTAGGPSIYVIGGAQPEPKAVDDLARLVGVGQ